MRVLGIVFACLLILGGGFGGLAALASDVYVQVDGRQIVQQDLMQKRIVMLIACSAVAITGFVILAGCLLGGHLAAIDATLEEALAAWRREDEWREKCQEAIQNAARQESRPPARARFKAPLR